MRIQLTMEQNFVRQILTPIQNKLTISISLPESFVGNELEVLIFPTNKSKAQKTSKKRGFIDRHLKSPKKHKTFIQPFTREEIYA